MTNRSCQSRGAERGVSPRRRALVLLWVAVGFATACDPHRAGTESRIALAAPETVRSEQLSERFGCDETFVAKDPQSTIVLAVRVPGVLRRALGAGLPYREELTAGGPELDVRLEQGADLDHWCTDMMARPPRIDATWFAREGTATVTIAQRLLEPAPSYAGSWRVPTRASVELEGLVLERRDQAGETRHIPRFTLEATIGEPAGG